MARREQLRGEGGVAHPTVVVAEAGVAGAAGGNLFCGCRSSVFAGPALRCANKTVVALVLLYGT